MPMHPTRRSWPLWPFLAPLGFACLGVSVWWYWPERTDSGDGPPLPDAPVERRLNVAFTADWPGLTDPPTVRVVELPKFPGSGAIWGATGRDGDGHVWVGVSFHDVTPASARLVEYDPAADWAVDRGDVLSALDSAGRLRAGTEQPKIHSRIVQADDGHLYFASSDDTPGEGGYGRPPWGAHLWRLRLPERQWEHLMAVPDALIAVAGAGPLVYALGYPNHKLVQYDTATGRTREVAVGSTGGHVSRNLVVDARGHAFVPRLRSDGGVLAASLVEFDRSLREVTASPLAHYVAGAADACHGIVGVQPLADGSVAFVTHRGRVYRVIGDGAGPARLDDLGWLHPRGAAYAPSLFSADGATALFSVGRVGDPPAGDYQWLRFDLRARLGFVGRFPLPEPDGAPLAGVLLYGSQTRDRAGNFYLAGSSTEGAASRPLLLRLGPPAAAPP